MRILRTLLAATLVGCAACGGSSGPGEHGSGPASVRGDVPMNKDAYPVFPDADASADPAVPADQGGRGFTGAGWETNTTYDLIGDPRAVKGGLFRRAMSDFPATLRYLGPNKSVWNATLHENLVYETLLLLHPTSLDYIPALATHWQISPDKLTYRFRIDPNGRFNDGYPVTADDVVASWDLNVDKSLQDPFFTAIYRRFERPVAESKYLVRVKAKDPGWANLFYFGANLLIYPAHALKGVTGASYIKDFNDKMLPGTGPYFVTPADVERGTAIHIRRRKDYWAERSRRNVGIANFDEIREVVVRDRNLEFEMVKRGDLDFYQVNRAQMWVEELNFDRIQNGQIQKRKVWNHSPTGLQGMAFNMRRAPYNDVRVRKALRHLFNRELMIQKLTYNEYMPQDSMFPGSIYENPKNEKIRFDPQAAVALLAEAGWKERNARGQLVKNGVPLSVEVLYYDRASERFHTIFQEELRKVGITVNLRFVTPETAFKLLDDQQFEMFGVAYGGGPPFPFPEQYLHSNQADQKASANVTGFKNKRVDEILALYDKEFDLKRRVALLQELDGIVAAEHPYILEWHAPYERFIYWNRFGAPRGLIRRVGDYRDPVFMWWLDPEKNARLDQAMRNPSMKLEAGAADDRFWLDFAKVEER